MSRPLHTVHSGEQHYRHSITEVRGEEFDGMVTCQGMRVLRCEAVVQSGQVLVKHACTLHCLQITDEQLQRTFASNIFGMFYLTKVGASCL